MAKFFVWMTEDDHAWARLSPAEQDALLAKYGEWFRRLRDEGRFVTGEPIGGPGRVLRRERDAVVESADASTKGVLTGFFVLTADDLAHATTIAHGCPALLHGETVFVRPIGHG